MAKVPPLYVDDHLARRIPTRPLSDLIDALDVRRVRPRPQNSAADGVAVRVRRRDECSHRVIHDGGHRHINALMLSQQREWRGDGVRGDGGHR